MSDIEVSTMFDVRIDAYLIYVSIPRAALDDASRVDIMRFNTASTNAQQLRALADILDKKELKLC